jgi:hypothetical protein
MIFNFFTTILLFSSPGHFPGDSLSNFQKKLERDICLYMELPPESDAGDTCFHYTELLKVEINKSSKVISLEFSDSAPEWLKEDLNKQKQRKQVNYKKLDSLAFKDGLRNCTLVFPFIIESEDFPCGLAKKKRSLSSKYFQFGGKNLKGNIIFCEEIRYLISINYIIKMGNNKGKLQENSNMKLFFIT